MNIISIRNKKKYADRAKKTMLGKWAETKDMLGPIVFLSSNASLCNWK